MKTLPTYEVESLELEQITVRTPHLIVRSRFRQFINNVALAIVTGTVTEETVFNQTTPEVFEAILQALTRFDEIDTLYKSRSTLGGDVNEYLNRNDFTFRNKPNGFTQ